MAAISEMLMEKMLSELRLEFDFEFIICSNKLL